MSAVLELAITGLTALMQHVYELTIMLGLLIAVSGGVVLYDEYQRYRLRPRPRHSKR